MKKAMKKTLCIFLLILILFNSIYVSNTFATSNNPTQLNDSQAQNTINQVDNSTSTGSSSSSQSSGGGIWGTIVDEIGGVIDGAAGILLTPFNWIGGVVGGIARAVASEVAEVGANSSQSVVFLSLEDIFFHNVDGKIPIIDVNFFEPNNSNKVILDIRSNIAGWYYAIRNLAIIVSLLVLIYIGIRMAISTLAEDRATYKKMLIDWIVGFATIFVLHYIIIGTVYINEALVKTLYQPQNQGFMNDYLDDIFLMAMTSFATGFAQGFAAMIVYLFMTMLILMFLFAYIKRMLTVAFLIIIAPIITVTYSIDKMGDGKSQALNTWLKEFVYNVLIQVFHCIIYLVFATVLIDVLNNASIGGGVLAIIIMLFMKQAENIVRNIFGFDKAKSLGSAFASGALLLSSMKAAKDSLEKVRGAQSQSGGSGGSTSNASGGNNGRKPNLRNTSNAGNSNSNSQNTSQQNGQSQSGSQQGAGSGTDSSGSQQGAGSETDSSGSQQGAGNGTDSSGSQQGAGSGTDSSGSQQDAGSGTDSENREFNTQKAQAQSKFKKALGMYGRAGLKTLELAAGIAMGGAISGNLTDMITARNFASVASNAGINLAGRGRNAVSNIGSNITRNARINTKTNNVIDAYNELKASKGWNDDRMLNETERVLGVSDTSKIRDVKLRNYAQTVQNLRTEYDGRYEEPNDMVLDRVTKIQSGEVRKTTPRRFTRPRTRNNNTGS